MSTERKNSDPKYLAGREVYLDHVVRRVVDTQGGLTDTEPKLGIQSPRGPTRMKRRVTIVDVAEACGVTPATVSRVLNGKRMFRASDEVRTRIHEAARKMGYVPDLAARNLNRNGAHILGLFASPYTHVAEGINESLLEGIADILNPTKYDVFMEFGAVSRRRDVLPFWRFDGALLLQAPKPETLNELDMRRVPYVCVNETIGSPVATVLADDQLGMRRAFEHLMLLGHRHIGYANAPANYFTHYSVAERHNTLTECIKGTGVLLAPGHDLPYSTSIDFLRHAVVGSGATAVITYDHNIAVALVGAAYSLGLKIPQDFSLVCFNDVFPVALLGPPLTAISVSGREMGRMGASLLLNALDATERTSPPTEIRVPEDLIVRGSTAQPKKS